MDYPLIFVFILSTLIFVIMILENASIDRCPYKGGKCYDGNGKYQYKGRGCEKESVRTLLSRVDWTAKNTLKKPLFAISYIIAYVLILGLMVVMYGSSKYTFSVYEYVVLLIMAYIITFSLINLINFHTDRYPIYYIRNNISYIADKLNLELDEEPDHPCNDKLPHRTYIQDKLYYK